MTSNDKCPFCASAKVLSGYVRDSASRAPRPNSEFGFDPRAFKMGEGTGHITWPTEAIIPFGPHSFFCVACGMLWSRGDTSQAAALIDRFANHFLKSTLSALDQKS